jgi:hypothetical protein
MKLSSMLEADIDRSRVPATQIPGASGSARVRVHRAGDTQLRLVEYEPDYLADHWCSKGHVLLVAAGALSIEHQDGTPACTLSFGMSWLVADAEGPAHRVRSDTGARVSIVD